MYTKLKILILNLIFDIYYSSNIKSHLNYIYEILSTSIHNIAIKRPLITYACPVWTELVHK